MTTNSTEIIQKHTPCPHCPSSDAYCVYGDGHGYCFSCLAYDPPKRETYLSSEFTYEYLPLRGITKETFKFYDCKTKINAEGKPVAIGFKYPNAAYKVRSLEKKSFYTENNLEGEPPVGLFGKDKFNSGSHRSITITEGELDAMSLYQVLKSPVVSVQSSSSARRDCTADREYINSFDKVYLAFDSDRAGLNATRDVASLFDYDKVYHVKFDRKDANDYLQQGLVEELRAIWWNARQYLPETVISSFKDFKDILCEEPRKGVDYPFPTLNNMTYGIRTGESVLITGLEGLGKTEFMHALEYQILKETSDEVGVAAIFLEEPKRRHLQAIAGIELKKPVHLPDTDATQSEVISALEKAVQKDERLHLYSHFGSSDPGVLEDTIRFLVSARSCSYVLLDHITMAVSGLSGEDERRALDQLSTKLEMMVKELNFALIMVSHVNDEGQTRGSRYISKIADIRIDLKRDLLSPDPLTRNKTELVVSKNRFSGKTGPAGVLVFDPSTFTYSEEISFANDNTANEKRAVA